jgi:RNA-directed DNA polymerase
MRKSWKILNWKTIEKRIFKLQHKIYLASETGDKAMVHGLQKVLINSTAAKLKAVRRVTQDNKGKNTAGIDNIKNLTPNERYKLAQSLEIDGKSLPVRRVLIPKGLNTSERRPLGIPTIKDRAKQALAHMALEPEWEAKFEPNSYGFRPGRSCHDALEGIFNSISKKGKYVLIADIRKCFDRIDHKALLAKLETFPQMEKQINAWLTAGILVGESLFPTLEGTPQGGVISPLLANVALHGIENLCNQQVDKWVKRHPITGKPLGSKQKRSELRLVRYADDFRLIHPDLEYILLIRPVLEEWLSGIGLEFHPEKTYIAHTLTPIAPKKCAGFDFLGVTIRQFRIGKYQIRKNSLALAFRTLMYPSSEKIKAHKEACKLILGSTQSPRVLIAKLTPVITGWTRYYRTVTSSRVFNSLNKWLFANLLSWAKRKHPTRSVSWVVTKYFRTVNPKQWIFGIKLPNGVPIWVPLHSSMKIVRHVKVQGVRSPYDGDWVYWGQKLSNYRQTAIPARVMSLLKYQKGRCNLCNLGFFPTDRVEVDHIIPRSRGGRDVYKNLQLLHSHCHKAKTGIDKSGSPLINEEPYDG